MARRDEGLLDVLVEVPWWVSIIVGIVVYIGMRFVIPALSAGNAFSNALAQGISQFAWVALIFLLPAGLSAFRSARKSQRLDRQTSIDSILPCSGSNSRTCWAKPIGARVTPLTRTHRLGPTAELT